MTQKPFVLSVKALVLDDRGQCLLLRRSARSRYQPGLWELPGGKCDAAEDMEAALLREIAEETGFTARLTRAVGSSQWEMDERVVVIIVFEAEVTAGELRLSDEHDSYDWVPRAELAGKKVAPQFRDVLRAYAGSAPPESPGGLNRGWYRQQVEGYGKVRPTYEKLAESLVAVLGRAADGLGLHCLVQARAKMIPSFAEKILRPGKSYRDPLRELTDLCGARVIAHTHSGVAAVCRYVEDHFDVSWPDSGDKLETLGSGEFGYRSRHYVVSFRPGVFPTDVVPGELLGLRAEVQVRTILQHAWADINHELSYKSRVKLPRVWQREFARLAAVLEDADDDFERISAGLGQYACSYGAYLSKERLREEIEKHAIMLAALPAPDPTIAHQLAKMAMSLEDWGRAVATLEPYADRGPSGLVRDLGVSLCKLHRKQPEGEGFAEGQALLERATALDPTDADARASLAGSWRTRELAATEEDLRRERRRRAKENYKQAFELDPFDPYPLGNYIEYEVADHQNVDVVTFFRPSLAAASRRCLAQIEVGINLPWAFFDLGKFRLMLGEPYEALSWYAKGAEDSTAAFFLDSALTSFTTLTAAGTSLPGLGWSQEFLRLARAVRFGEPGPAASPPAPGSRAMAEPVVVVAGYCDAPAPGEHLALLADAFRGFQGTVISGGTEDGVSGLVGRLREASGPALRAVGYSPGGLPDGVRPDPRYDEHRPTPGAGFSPLEPLCYWSDLHAAGVSPGGVKVLAIGGGRLAAAECQIALALGASVGLVAADGNEVGRSLGEPPWSGCRRLRTLAPDPESLRSFLGLTHAG